jgi:hypothetical protein
VTSEDWAKLENKELKKKLGQVRTKHLFYILCFPLKIQKVDKTYLENYVNYWIDLYARGKGALFVKDMNPCMESWRIKDFTKIGSYTEFTPNEKVQSLLSQHPNFWYIIRAPKPAPTLYNKYLKVREYNVYDDANVLNTVNKNDILRALLLLTLKEILYWIIDNANDEKSMDKISNIVFPFTNKYKKFVEFYELKNIKEFKEIKHDELGRRIN